jgi:hypothetical protein
VVEVRPTAGEDERPRERGRSRVGIKPLHEFPFIITALEAVIYRIRPGPSTPYLDDGPDRGLS